MARLPRPRFPSSGRLRGRIRARRGSDAGSDEPLLSDEPSGAYSGTSAGASSGESSVQSEPTLEERRREILELLASEREQRQASSAGPAVPADRSGAADQPRRRGRLSRLRPRRRRGGGRTALRRKVGGGSLPGDRGRGRLATLRAAAPPLASRVRDRLDDAALATRRIGTFVAHSAQAVGSAARAAWLRLSLATRQRIAAAAGVTAIAAVIWFGAIPVLPCQFPAGEVCPPSDDAAEIVPADSLAYVHANIDPETEQFRAARDLGAELPGIAAQLLGRLPGPAGVPLDFDRQLRPWLDGEVAMAIVPGERRAGEQLFLFEVGDAEGAERFASQIASGPQRELEHEGTELRIDQRGTASAIAGDFLLVGDRAAVERTIEVAGGDGRALAASPLGDQVLDRLPDKSLAQVAVSEQGAADILADPGSSLASLDTFVDFEATTGAGAALVVADDAVEVAIHSELDPERAESSPGFFEALPPFEPTLAAELSAETLAYIGIGDPATSAERLLDQAAATAPALAAAFDDLAGRLRRAGRVDLTRDLLPLLEGEAALAIEPSPPPERQGRGQPDRIAAVTPGIPYLTFVADQVETEQASEALAKLQAPLAKSVDPASSGQAPVFAEQEIEGVEAHSLRVSPAVELTYATFDQKLVVSTSSHGIAQVRGDGGLDTADLYARAMEGMPSEPAMIAFFDLAGLVALAEREGLAADPAYALFATDVRKLAALGLAVERGDSGLATKLRVTLDGS